MSLARKTVVHVVQNLDVGGLERVVINLMTRGSDDRFRPVLYCLGSGGVLGEDLSAAGYRVRAMQKRRGMDCFLLARMGRLLRTDGADIVHCHNFSPLVYGSIAGRLAGACAVVYTAHGARTSGRRKQRLFQRFGLVDEMVFVSDDARRVALASGAVSAGRTRTITNGIDIARYERADGRDAVRRALGIDDHEIVFGIVARLTAAKDHVTLLRAFAEVKRARAHARLLVVGDGELARDVHEAAAQLGISEAVVFTGARNDVPEMLSAMDVYVLSSYTEGLAMTLLEAMAAGLPIVATRVGGNPEVVVDGENGFLVPARDSPALAGAMMRTMEADCAARMGKVSRRLVAERFSVERMIADYESLYTALVSRRTR